jgi:hypothetical protein
MDNRLKQDALIEDALTSQPLAEMPRNVTMDVMARIQKETRPKLVTSNDFVLSLVLALSVVAVFFALQSLPPFAIAKLRIQGILLYQDILVNARWLLPTLLFGAAAFLSALTLPTLIRMTIKKDGHTV